jgi:hypothetical protein
MAVHQISIMGLIQPDSTGRCWVEPYDVIATNDVWKHPVVRFKDPSGTQAHGFYGQFTVPQNYVGTAAVIPIWTTTATSGTPGVRWAFTYRTVGGDDTTSLDQTSNEESVAVVDAPPGAANRRMTPSISPTSANFAAGDTVEYFFARDDNPGSADNVAADAVLHDLLFSYADA